MKPTYLLPVLLLVLIFAYVLPAQAQTKEETIAWVKEKFEKYPSGHWVKENLNVVKIEITPCSIKVTHSGDDYYGEKVWERQGFPLSEELLVKTVNSKIFVYPNEIAKLVSKEKRYVFNKPTDPHYSRWFPLRNGEPNFAERMQKALRHLATFCEEKKEVF